LLNGTTVIVRTSVRTFSGNPTDDDTLVIETDWALNVGDFVEFHAISYAAGATVKAIDAFTPEAWIAWQRRQ